MIRNLTLTALCGLTLVACHDKPAPEAPTTSDAVAETAGTANTDTSKSPDADAADTAAAAISESDLRYVSESDAYILKATVDPEIRAFDPALAAALMQTARGELATFEVSSADLREEGRPPFAMEVNVDAVARKGDLISIETGTYAYAGGAHPNMWTTAQIYRRGEPAPVPAASLFFNTDQLKALVIAALVEEKIARGYAPTERAMIEGELNDALAGDETWLRNVSLVDSDAAGKFGGVRVLFAPYDIGAYAEGAYAPLIPARALEPMLKPDAKPLFGGAPVQVAD